MIAMREMIFSRGQALNAGAKSITHPNPLLFFADVDISFNYETLERIRLNTILGVQV